MAAAKVAAGFESSVPFHYPDAKYMGPGTHVISNVLNNVKPTSQPDRVALYHDIDYLSNKEPIMADLKAIINSDSSFQGLIMKAGLGVRSAADLLYHILFRNAQNPTHLNGRSDTLAVATQELQHQLKLTAANNGNRNPAAKIYNWKYYD